MKRMKQNRKRLGTIAPRSTAIEGDLQLHEGDSASLDSSFEFGFNEENPFEPEPIREVESICMGRVKCVHCGKIYGFCSTIEYELTLETPKENTTMLPAATSGSGGGGNNNQQQQSGQRQQRKQNGLPYIKAENLSFDKKIAKILDVRVAEAAADGQRNFSDIKVKIAMGGATWMYGLKLSNPELKKLQSAFSLDENNWPGKQFYFFLEEDEFDQKVWMRVEPIIPDEGEEDEPAPAATSRRRKAGAAS